jgi:lipopolysaccharide exporter
MQEASDLKLNSKEHPDLYHKSVKGGYWVSLLQLVMNLLSFVKVIIIANFFFLEDLGIISVALMMMEILTTFTETGFDAALIQKKEKIHDYLDTAWTTGLVKGIILFAILYCAAPVLASVPVSASIQVSQDKVALTISILRAMSICFLISGLKNVGVIYFQKELKFRKVFMMSFVFSLVDIILSIAFVYIFRSVWGVILARIIAVAANCICGYILSPYRPRLHFEFAKACELSKFGKWIYGNTIVGYIISRGDTYFLWSYLGLSQLALYKYAYDFATMPATQLAGVISSVSFPAYSKIQNDIPRLREAYLKVLKATILLSAPASCLILILGSDFVHLFFPERMYPMIFILQLLTFKGFMSSFTSTIGPVYQSVNKPQIMWVLMVCFLLMLATLIYPLTKMWGIAGTALATIIPVLCICPVNVMILCRILRCSLLSIVRVFLLPLGASAVMACFVFLFKTLIFIYSDSMSFLLAFDVSTVEAFPVFLLKTLNIIRPDCISFVSLGILAITVYGLAVWYLDGLVKQGVREIIGEQMGLVKKRLGM